MDVRRHVFLGYKEILHNVARHARATDVTIRVDEDRSHLHLTVSDNGVGFDANAPSPGHGLKHLQERAARIGGTLTITSRPGAGTTILFVAPRTTGKRKTT
jgi:signal transduction histidine kinase